MDPNNQNYTDNSAQTDVPQQPVDPATQAPVDAAREQVADYYDQTAQPTQQPDQSAEPAPMPETVVDIPQGDTYSLPTPEVADPITPNAQFDVPIADQQQQDYSYDQSQQPAMDPYQQPVEQYQQPMPAEYPTPIQEASYAQQFQQPEYPAAPAEQAMYEQPQQYTAAPQYPVEQPVQQDYQPMPTAVDQPQSPLGEGYGAGTTYTSTQPKKSKLPIALAILGLLFFGFLIYGFILIFGGSGDGGDTAQTDTSGQTQDEDTVVEGVTDADRELLKNAYTNSVKRVSQTVAYETTLELGTVNFDLNVDYSDPSNVILAGDVVLNSSATEGESKFNVVIPGDGEVYIRINEFDEPDLSVAEGDIGTWFIYPQNFSSITEDEYDFLVDDQTAQVLAYIARITTPIAATTGEIPEGNFTNEQQQELIDLYDQESPYEVTAAESETVDGTGYKILTFTVDGEKLASIVEKMEEYNSASYDDFIDSLKSGEKSTFKVRVNETTKNIERFETVSASEPTVRTATNFDQQFSIEAPEGAVNALEE